jgi:hypothetical protein
MTTTKKEIVGTQKKEIPCISLNSNVSELEQKLFCLPPPDFAKFRTSCSKFIYRVFSTVYFVVFPFSIFLSEARGTNQNRKHISVN